MKHSGIAMKFLLPIIFPAILFAQPNLALSQLSHSVSVPAIDSSEEHNIMRDQNLWIENVADRTIFSSSFKTPDGRIIIHSSASPLNYYDAAGALQKIVAEPKVDANGWSAQEQPYPTYLFSDGSAAVSTSKELKFIFGKNLRVNGNSIAPRVPVMSGAIATIANVIPGMNKEYNFRSNGIKYNYILNQPAPTSNGFLTISEEMEIPAGYFLKRKEEHGREQEGGWCGDFELISPKGEVSSIIYAPLCFDANKNWTLGTYKLKNENGHQFLELLVSASWLNDASRSYPITIDPLIIGPIAYWPGNLYMPSCIAPAFNSDSILVTLPGGIAVTGLIVTASFYADPFTTAVMSDGAMRFSTSCGTTSSYTLPLATGNLPGTAYLDTANIRSPLMCCFPQSCTQRTFYLRMHLNRTAPSTGCNTTYIRYDPFTTLWPFQAFVEGRTPETYGLQWSVQTAPICSDVCTFTGRVYMRYGVPPYTITHPWMTNTITVGTPAGCSFSVTNTQLTLTRPNCPTYCDTITLLAVPPPTVVDACGELVYGLPTKYLHLISTPVLTSSPNPDSLCSGTPVNITLTSCLPNSTIAWSGNNINGSGNIVDTINNVSNAATSTNYIAVATSNGCASDTVTIPVVVDPIPVASFIFTDPAISGVPMSFTNTTPIYAGTGTFFYWNFGDTTFASVENPTHTYLSPGIRNVCFYISTSHGCGDTICQEVTVIPAQITCPNIITPNADGVNDLLVFKYLEYYNNNHLDIYDRWGMQLLSKDSYQNNWDGSKYTDGTYYYILTTKDDGKQYSGFFQIIK